MSAAAPTCARGVHQLVAHHRDGAGPAHPTWPSQWLSTLLGWFLGLLVLASVAIALGNHTSLYGSQGDAPVARWTQAMLESWRRWLSKCSGVPMAAALGIIGTILIIRSLTWPQLHWHPDWED